MGVWGFSVLRRPKKWYVRGSCTNTAMDAVKDPPTILYLEDIPMNHSWVSQHGLKKHALWQLPLDLNKYSNSIELVWFGEPRFQECICIRWTTDPIGYPIMPPSSRWTSSTNSKNSGVFISKHHTIFSRLFRHRKFPGGCYLTHHQDDESVWKWGIPSTWDIFHGDNDD